MATPEENVPGEHATHVLSVVCFSCEEYLPFEQYVQLDSLINPNPVP